MFSLLAPPRPNPNRKPVPLRRVSPGTHRADYISTRHIQPVRNIVTITSEEGLGRGGLEDGGLMKLVLFLFGLVVLPAHAKTYLCIGEQSVWALYEEES